MRRISLPLTLALCLPMLASACTESPAEQSTSELLAELDVTYDSIAEQVCPCPETNGGDEAFCRDLFKLLSFEEPCIAEGVEALGEPGREALACQLEQLRAHDECLADTFVCSADALDLCPIDQTACRHFDIQSDLEDGSCTVNFLDED